MGRNDIHFDNDLSQGSPRERRARANDVLFGLSAFALLVAMLVYAIAWALT
jgi:hypothetical protein